MSITKEDIVAALNDDLITGEDTNPSNQMVRRLNAGLRWLSEQGLFPCLHHYSTDLLAASEDSISKPDDFYELDCIVLNDGTYDSKPLTRFQGGFSEYLKGKENLTTSGYDEPKQFVEHGTKIYFGPPANGSYTVKIWFWRYCNNIDNILFPDEFEEAVYNACIAAYLDGKGRHDKAKYYCSLALKELSGKKQDFKPRFTMYNDL
jgi:hypothetical protein